MWRLRVRRHRATGWTEALYEEARVRFLSTATHGAITIHSKGRELVVETYRTRQHWVLRAGQP